MSDHPFTFTANCDDEPGDSITFRGDIPSDFDTDHPWYCALTIEDGDEVAAVTLTRENTAGLVKALSGWLDATAPPSVVYVVTLVFADGSTRRYHVSTPDGPRAAAETAAARHRASAADPAFVRIAGAYIVSDDAIWFLEDGAYVAERDGDAA